LTGRGHRGTGGDRLLHIQQISHDEAACHRLAANTFAVFRLGLWSVGWCKPCSYPGNLTGPLYLGAQEAGDSIKKVIPAYLLIASSRMLLWQWREGRPADWPVTS